WRMFCMTGRTCPCSINSSAGVGKRWWRIRGFGISAIRCTDAWKCSKPSPCRIWRNRRSFAMSVFTMPSATVLPAIRPRLY
ncbi:hypothetical protein, partial [Pseudomonas sp. FEN]